MITIGITGGIGSGKTTVTKLLSLMGIAIYNTDIEGKRIMNHDPNVIGEIKQLFGEEAYRNGRLDNNYIAQIVFRSRKILDRLNAIVHPAVIYDFRQWAANEKGEIIGIESAILFESNMAHLLNYTIGVVAPLEMRMERVSKRSGLSAEAIAQRMSKQMDDETLKSRCHFVIQNDDKHSIVRQVNDIVNQIGSHQKAKSAQ